MDNIARLVRSPDDFLGGCREDLQRLGVDYHKVQGHVHSNMRAGTWLAVYRPSFSALSEPPPGDSVPNGERKQLEKTYVAAKLVEIMLAHDIASKDSALISMGICLDESARQAAIAQESLRVLVERERHVRAARAKGGIAGHRRHGPARLELIRLLHANKPVSGWPDIGTAVFAILPEVLRFLAQNPSLQQGKNLSTTLKRWMKEKPDVALAFEQTKCLPDSEN